MDVVEFVRVTELHRWVMVELWRRENHHTHHKPQGEARPGTVEAWKNGHAHSHVLLLLPRLQGFGLKLLGHFLGSSPLWGD